MSACDNIGVLIAIPPLVRVNEAKKVMIGFLIKEGEIHATLNLPAQHVCNYIIVFTKLEVLLQFLNLAYEVVYVVHLIGMLPAHSGVLG